MDNIRAVQDKGVRNSFKFAPEQFTDRGRCQVTGYGSSVVVSI